PPGLTLSGSPFFGTPPSEFVPTAGQLGPVSGTVSLKGNFTAILGNTTGGTVTYQWVIEGGTTNFLSPVLTFGSPNWPSPSVYGPALTWAFDTRLLPDGTYIHYPRILDWDNFGALTFQPQPGTLIIANSPPLSIAAGQVIPIAEIQGHLANPKPDRLTYDGVPY